MIRDLTFDFGTAAGPTGLSSRIGQKLTAYLVGTGVPYTAGEILDFPESGVSTNVRDDGTATLALVPTDTIGPGLWRYQIYVESDRLGQPVPVPSGTGDWTFIAALQQAAPAAQRPYLIDQAGLENLLTRAIRSAEPQSDLIDRVDDLEALEETRRFEKDIVTRSEVSVGSPNIAYSLGASAPTDSSGRELVVLVTKSGESDTRKVIDLTDLLAKPEVEQANRPLTSANGIEFTSASGDNQYRIGVDNQRNLFFSSSVTGNPFFVTVTDSQPAVSDEHVQDVVGGMVTGNTETGGTLTYNDGTGKLNLTVTGGGGGSGLTAVATNNTIDGDGTAGSPLAVTTPFTDARVRAASPPQKVAVEQMLPTVPATGWNAGDVLNYRGLLWLLISGTTNRAEFHGVLNPRTGGGFENDDMEFTATTITVRLPFDVVGSNPDSTVFMVWDSGDYHVETLLTRRAGQVADDPPGSAPGGVGVGDDWIYEQTSGQPLIATAGRSGGDPFVAKFYTNAAKTTALLVVPAAPRWILYDRDTPMNIVTKLSQLTGTDRLPATAVDGDIINVKPDWDAAAGTPEEILHKPTIPAAPAGWATDGFTGTIPEGRIPDGIARDSELPATAADWAEDGNTDLIPTAKLPTIPEAKIPDGIARDRELPAAAADWAEDGNTDLIPTAKLPIIPDAKIPSGIARDRDIPAAQVPADWNATTGVTRVLNKPTIPAGETGTTIVSKLESLTGTNRLQASAIRDLPEQRFTAVEETKLQGIQERATRDQSPTEIKGSLESLTGNDRLDASAVKNLPSSTVVTDDSLTGIGTSSNPLKVANEFTNADENKLDGIAIGAEVNVNADWNAVSGDALIENKPTIPAAPADWAKASGATGTIPDDRITGATIVTKLVGLTGTARLPASAVRDIQEGTGNPADWAEDGNTDLIPTAKLPIIPDANIPAGIARDSELTGATIVTKLQGLSGQARLDASAVKNLPTSTGDPADWAEDGNTDLIPTAKLPTIPVAKIPSEIARDSDVPDAETGATIVSKLVGLAPPARLPASAIRDLPSSSGGSSYPLRIKKVEPPLPGINPAGAEIFTASEWTALGDAAMLMFVVKSWSVLKPNIRAESITVTANGFLYTGDSSKNLYIKIEGPTSTTTSTVRVFVYTSEGPQRSPHDGSLRTLVVASSPQVHAYIEVEVWRMR